MIEFVISLIMYKLLYLSLTDIFYFVLFYLVMNFKCFVSCRLHYRARNHDADLNLDPYSGGCGC